MITMVVCPRCNKEVATITYTAGEKPRAVLKWHNDKYRTHCDGSDRTVEEIQAAESTLQGREAGEENK